MTFDKFTIKAQEAVQEAVNTAQRAGQQTIEPTHLLAGIIAKGKDVTNFLFQKLGVNGSQIEKLVQQEIAHLPRVTGGEPYFSNATSQVLQRSIDLAKQMGDEFVSIEPMLLAMLESNSTAGRIMKDAGCNEKDLKKAIQELRQGANVQSQSGDENYQALSKYAKNLVEDARAGKLDPVIGRDEEIRRVLQILSRRTKNNPSSSANRERERPPSWKVWHNVSCVATCRKTSRTSNSSPWTWEPCWRVPSTRENLRNDSRGWSRR